MALSALYTGEADNRFVFTDTQDTQYEEPVKIVTSNHIMSGYPNGSFKPEKEITRAELIATLNKLTGRTKSVIKKEYTFSDLKKSSWYYYEIQAALQGK